MAKRKKKKKIESFDEWVLKLIRSKVREHFTDIGRCPVSVHIGMMGESLWQLAVKLGPKDIVFCYVSSNDIDIISVTTHSARIMYNAVSRIAAGIVFQCMQNDGKSINDLPDDQARRLSEELYGPQDEQGELDLLIDEEDAEDS